VSGDISINKKNTANAKMYSYDAAASSKKMYASKMSDADYAFVRMKSSVESLKGADKGFAMIAEHIKFDYEGPTKKTISLQPKESYRVVADFYLPHLVHNYKIEVDPLDACEELGEVKMIDFSAITKDLTKDVLKEKGDIKFSKLNIHRKGDGE